MRRTIPLLSTAMFASIGAFAQPPTTYNLRPVVTPVMNIGGEDIGKCWLPDPAALNDNGDIAFLAFCKRDAIFAPPRTVVTDGDVVDGKFIKKIPWSALVGFNNQGQVLYKAFFSDNEHAPMETWSEGLFLDRRFLAPVKSAEHDTQYDYSLSDDGRVLAHVPNPDSALIGQANRAQKKPFPCSVDAPQTGNVQSSKFQGTPPGAAFMLPQCGFPSFSAVLPTNRYGQFLLPLNFQGKGFMILLATPATH